MNIFKPYTLNWQHGSIFKISMISGGIAIGTYWYQFFTQFILLFVTIAVIGGLYVSYDWWKQIK